FRSCRHAASQLLRPFTGDPHSSCCAILPYKSVHSQFVPTNLAKVAAQLSAFPYGGSGGLLPVTPRLVERAAPLFSAPVTEHVGGPAPRTAGVSATTAQRAGYLARPTSPHPRGVDHDSSTVCSGVAGRSCASATASLVSLPACVLIPSANAWSASAAARQPCSASCTT